MSRSIRMPHTLVLMFIMMIVALLLTWVLPAGSFETVTNDSGRDVVQPGTFALVEDAETLPPWHLFTAVPRAMADVQGIIFFVLLIGGSLAVIRKTGAIEAFLGSVIKRFGNNAFWLISLGVFLFAAASATLGMAEEYIPAGRDSDLAVRGHAHGHGRGHRHHGGGLLRRLRRCHPQSLHPVHRAGHRRASAGIRHSVSSHHFLAFPVYRHPPRLGLCEQGAAQSRSQPGIRDRICPATGRDRDASHDPDGDKPYSAPPLWRSASWFTASWHTAGTWWNWARCSLPWRSR